MPTAPGYADCSVGYQQTGLPRLAFMTFGVDPVDTDPLLVEASVFAAVTDAGSLNSVMDSSATLTRIRVSLGTDGVSDVVADVGHTTVGGSAVTALPGNCAVLVHKRSSRGGRRGRGRMFIPWAVGETSVDEVGGIQTATVTALQTAMTAFRVALTTRGVPMVLLHGLGKTAIPPPDPVTTLVVDRLIGTQRRRLGR